MPKILAIDTSTDACSAALLIDDKISDSFVVAPKQHTNLILPMIDELLSKEHVSLKELDAIAFGSGPGSFTGIRLAASIVQGLAFASNIPVIKVSTLRVLAQEVFAIYRSSQVFVAEDARMQEIYWGEYQVDQNGIMQRIQKDILVKPDKAKSFLRDGFVATGSGFEVYKELLAKESNIRILNIKYVQAKYLVQLAADDLIKGLAVSVHEAEPVYLREKVAWA